MDTEKIVIGIVDFIREYFNKYKLSGVVIGISGGKDSAVVAGLFSLALGCQNVIGVTLPCHSKKEDKDDAKKISDFFGFKLHNMDLTYIYDSFLFQFMKSFNIDNKYLYDSNINIKPKLRMSSLYYVAQAISNLENKKYIVAGTSNKCELYVGYFTKGGDNVCDINVIGNLTVSDVIKVGEYLNVPSDILYKTPADGLTEMSDEEKLGVTYDMIEKVINKEDVPQDIYLRIEKLHKNSDHKFMIPMYVKGK